MGMSIIVSLLMATGSFESDSKRAEKRLQAFEKSVQKVGAAIGLAFGAAAVAGFAVFDRLVKGAADFQDMAEMTGASAEAMASYSVAAATAGVSMESVSGAMIKLTKSLIGVDDESKAAGTALGSLGLNVAEFKKLDPSAQYEAVGKALGGFADGAGKTAIALTLFGKAGAEQLKVFKALEEQGGRTVILTAEQIKQADAYADAQAKLKTEIGLTAQAIATSALPALTEMANVLRDVGKEFDIAGAATTIFKLALDGLTVVFQTVAIVAANLEFVFSAVGREIGAVAAQLVALASGDLTGFRAISDAVKADGARARAELDKFEARVMGIGKAKYVDPRILGSVGSIAEQTAVNRPRLNFEGAPDKAKKAPALSEAQRYLETLQKQSEAVAELSNYERVLAEIQSGRLTGMTPKIKEQALAYATVIDQMKYEEAQRRSLEDAIMAERQAREQVVEMSAAEARGMKETNDAFALQIEEIGLSAEAHYALESARISSAVALKQEAINALTADEINRGLGTTLETQIEQLNRRAALLGDKQTAEAFAEQQREMEESTRSLRDTLEGTLGQGLQDAMDGNFKNIGQSFAKMLQKMLIDAATADIMNSLFGKKGGTSSGGFSSLLSGIAGLFGGGASAGGYTGVAGAAGNNISAYTPMASGGVVPRDNFLASLHKGEMVVPKGQMMGGPAKIIIENHGSDIETQQSTSPSGEEITKLIVRIKREVANDIRGGGGDVASAIKARGVSLSGGLPRRG